MSEANTDGDGLPEQPVVMRLTEGAVPESPDCYADPEFDYDTDDEEGYCLRCDNEGYVVGCCDDLCHGQGYCMHGCNITCPECHGKYSW